MQFYFTARNEVPTCSNRHSWLYAFARRLASLTESTTQYRSMPRFRIFEWNAATQLLIDFEVAEPDEAETNMVLSEIDGAPTFSPVCSAQFVVPREAAIRKLQ